MCPVGVVIGELDLIERAMANHHLLTSTALHELGMNPGRWERLVDKGLWIQVAPGHFRHAATPLTFPMMVRAGAGWLGRRGALFGTTALWWLGVDVPEPTHADFLVPRSSRSIPNWMTIHTSKMWSARNFVWHEGVRTTTAGRAIIDHASTMPSARSLENAIDSAISIRRTAMPRLSAELARVSRRGRPGVRLMRELLIDSGGESPLERRFLQLLRQHGLPRPSCQVVFHSSGKFVARVDFAFGRLVVEVMGRLGHVSDRDRQRDTRRRNALTREGLEVVEFTTADVIDDPAYIVRTLAERGLVAGSSPSLAVGPRQERSC